MRISVQTIPTTTPDKTLVRAHNMELFIENKSRVVYKEYFIQYCISYKSSEYLARSPNAILVLCGCHRTCRICDSFEIIMQLFRKLVSTSTPTLSTNCVFALICNFPKLLIAWTDSKSCFAFVCGLGIRDLITRNQISFAFYQYFRTNRTEDNENIIQFLF